MVKQGNFTTRFRVDISELKKGIEEAKSNIKVANAQFKAASAGMDDWKNSTEGLQAKLKQLRTVLDNEVVKLKNYKAQLQELEKAEKENATRAEELKAKLKELAENGVSRTSVEYKKYEKALNAVEKEQIKNQKSIEKGRIEILNQQAAVNKTVKDLRTYKNRLDEVKEASKQLDGASKDVEDGIEDIGDSAVNAADDVKDLKDGFTTLKGAMANLISDGIGKLIDGFKNFGKEIMDNEKSLYKFQSKTGKSAEEMSKFNDAIHELYEENWGESVSDIADSMAIVAQTSKEVDPDKIKDLTKNAIILRDTFDFDVNESMRAANMLIDQFGITGEQAFNLIAQGAQKGLDKNGDLLDTINEYSVHYQKLGYTSEEFFNSLANGAADGTFSVDKLGDAMKEFGIRAKDTATTTTEGFELIGLNADEMRNKFAAGGESAKKATQETVKALFGLNDEVKRNQAGVDLFGTMWEDLGEDAIRSIMDINGGISLTNDTLNNIETNSVQDLGTQFQALGRDVKSDLVYPIGKELLPVLKDILKSIIPSLKKAISFMIKNIKPLGSMVLGLATAWGTYKATQKTANTITTITTTLMKLSTTATKANAVATNGATVATKALSLAQKMTPWGMVAGLITGVVVGLGTYVVASMKSRKETDENVIATKKLIDEHKELKDTLKEGDEARRDNIKSAEEQGATADILFKKIEELNGVEKKSVSQKEMMKQLVDQLNEVMPELNLKYDAEKDALNMSTEAIKGNIEAQKDLLIAKAAQENSLSIAQDIAKLEVENAKITEQHLKNEQALKEVEEERAEALRKGLNPPAGTTEKWAKVKDAFNESEKALNENNKQLEELHQNLDNNTKFVDDMFNQAELQKKLNSLTKTCEEAGVKIPEAVNKGIKSNKYALPKSVEEMKSLIQFQSMEEKALKSGVSIPQNIAKGISDGSIKPNEAIKGMSELVSFSELLSKSNKAGIQVPEEISKGVYEGKLTVQQAIDQMERLIEFNDLLSKSDAAGQAVPKEIEAAILEGKMSPKEAVAEMNRVMNEELDKQPPKAKKTGEETGKQYTAGVGAYTSHAYTAGSNVGSSSVQGTQNGSSGANKAGKTAGQHYASGFNSTWSNAYTAGNTVGAHGVQGVRSQYENAKSSGTYIAAGINKGVNDSRTTLFTTMRNLVNNMLLNFNKEAVIHSPSEAFANRSKFIPLGIAKGIDDNKKTVMDSLRDLTQNALKINKKAGSDMVGNMIDGIKSRKKELKANIRSLTNVEQMKAKVIDARNSIQENSTRAVGSIKDNLEKAKAQIVYNQYITSPKATDRFEIRRQTKNTLRMIKGNI